MLRLFVGSDVNNHVVNTCYDFLWNIEPHFVFSGYLHSHYHIYPEGVGAKQQQVTTYAHKVRLRFVVSSSCFHKPRGCKNKPRGCRILSQTTWL